MSSIFDVNELQDCVDRVLPGKSPEEMYSELTQLLAERYPGQIEEEWRWFFNYAAGFMQVLTILHVSLHEYLILVGSPLPTGGGNGPFRNDIHDFILDGELCIYSAGQFTAKVHTPGERAFTPKGESLAGAIPDHVWMMEYSKGSLLGMLPIPLAGTLFSTLDYRTMFRMSWHICKVGVKQWWNRTFGANQSVKRLE